MIDFDHIGDFSRSYDFYNRYLRVFHNHFYYKHRYLVNKQNIPERGKPIMVIANHQNGVNDAMNILYLFDDRRQPVFIARGDIFKKDFVAKLLRFFKILPTFRSRDGGVSDIRFNSTTFNLAADILGKGGTVVIFPEAQHQHGHYIGTFKKGFPRVAFLAEEKADFKLGLQILPVNIHYQDYYSSRTDVVLTVGKPFTFDELFEQYKTEPNLAYQALNEKARAHLKNITPDVVLHDEYYEEIDLLRLVWAETRLKAMGIKGRRLYKSQPFEVAALDDVFDLKESDEPRFLHLMSITKSYIAELKRLNLRSWVIGRRASLMSQLLHSFWRILVFPIFLICLIVNFIPYYFPYLLRRKIKDRQLHSSFNYVGGMVSFTLCYPIFFALAWIISKSFLFAVVFFFALIFSLIFFTSYKRSFPKFIARWRYRICRRKGETAQAERLKKEICDMALTL